jgi:hypothetical protein
MLRKELSTEPSLAKTMQSSMPTTSLYETQLNQDLWLLRCVIPNRPLPNPTGRDSVDSGLILSGEAGETAVQSRTKVLETPLGLLQMTSVGKCPHPKEVPHVGEDRGNAESDWHLA